MLCSSFDKHMLTLAAILGEAKAVLASHLLGNGQSPSKELTSRAPEYCHLLLQGCLTQSLYRLGSVKQSWRYLLMGGRILCMRM